MRHSGPLRFCLHPLPARSGRTDPGLRAHALGNPCRQSMAPALIRSRPTACGSPIQPASDADRSSLEPGAEKVQDDHRKPALQIFQKVNTIALRTGGFGKAPGAFSPRRNRGGLIVQDRPFRGDSVHSFNGRQATVPGPGAVRVRRARSQKRPASHRHRP